MSELTAASIVQPSNLAVGEEFSLKIKLKGELVEYLPKAQWNTPKPSVSGPFNINIQRDIRFFDDSPEGFVGEFEIIGDSGLEGENSLTFDGENQGVYVNDNRPIKTIAGFKWSEPGFHFITLENKKTGQIFRSNPCYVSAEKPERKLVWGDPHWQTFFSDGIRCPEELYAFARDEAFLDFGAISDHMEAITPRQWEYFQAVTNDYNEDGKFATLIGQEWTHHKCGHRNIYFKQDSGPLIGCLDPKYDNLEKLWKAADEYAEGGGDVLLIPHHPSNVMMGCDWDLGWNEKYEKVVEICSVWGSSECSEKQGNAFPLRHCKGEMDGRHVRDALARKYRFGFVGGGDIHDGRAGDSKSYITRGTGTYRQGYTACWLSELNRGEVFDAIAARQTYATNCNRIYLDSNINGNKIDIKTAAEDGLKKIVAVADGKEAILAEFTNKPLSLENSFDFPGIENADYVYIRIEAGGENAAWGSPHYL